MAAAAGYGRDPGAIGRGMEAGQKVLDRPQADADKQRTDKIQSAKEAIDQHEYNYNQEREGYADSMTGYRDKTARMGEENREDNDAAKNKEKAGEIDPKAKPQKITENGKDKWVIKTRGGSYVDTDPPAEKTYKSAYERSQSSNPDEAKQGRADYDTEQKRSQQRADADTTRANKAGQGRGSHGKDVLDKAKRDYNSGLNKARGKLQESRSLATSIPGWDKKPMLKNQVQQAYDDYNENAKALFDEYKGQTGEDAELPAPAPLPYPWEKGGQQGEGSTPPAKQSKPSPASPAQPPASGQGKKTVQTYKSPKSGKTYNVGDTIKGGAYDGKKIGAIYEDGTMELQ